MPLNCFDFFPNELSHTTKYKPTYGHTTFTSSPYVHTTITSLRSSHYSCTPHRITTDHTITIWIKCFVILIFVSRAQTQHYALWFNVRHSLLFPFLNIAVHLFSYIALTSIHKYIYCGTFNSYIPLFRYFHI